MAFEESEKEVVMEMELDLMDESLGNINDTEVVFLDKEKIKLADDHALKVRRTLEDYLEQKRLQQEEDYLGDD